VLKVAKFSRETSVLVSVSHVNIAGNERADTAAKAALLPVTSMKLPASELSLHLVLLTSVSKDGKISGTVLHTTSSTSSTQLLAQ